LFKPSHPVVVKDLVVINDFAEDHSTANDGRINSSILIYLITDRVLQTSVKNVLTSDEFSIVYGKERVPELKISGELIPRNIGYSIKIKYKHVNGKTIDEVYDFADPAALLDPNKGVIPSIIHNIIESNSSKSFTRAYTFTSSWDAFEEFYQGEKAWQKLDITNAERHYKNALTYDNQFILTKLRYAQLLNFNGYDLEAKEIIKEIKPNIEQMSWLDSLKTEALEARLNGNFFEENNILKNIFNRYPTRKECAYEVAESYYAKCDVENAIIYYQDALKLDQNFALAHNHIGYCYSHIGTHALALRHFKIYQSLDSTANSYDSYGDGFMTAGKLDSAEWAKKEGIIRDSNLYYLWGSLGLINLRQGKFKEADRNFQQYINLAKGNKARAGGYFRKALIPFSEGKYNDALKLCLFARNLYDTIDIGTRDHEMHWLMGYLFLLLKEPDKAKVELAIMARLANSNNISATNYQIDFYKFRLHLGISMNAYNSNLTEMLAGMAEFDGAIKNKIKDHTSTFDLAFFNTSFGELLLWNQINKPDLAEKRFLLALEYNPNYALAHYDLWRLYQIEGKNEQANQHLLKFKDIWKNADPEIKHIYGI
jgi:Tfp pilus assembly protein PilF